MALGGMDVEREVVGWKEREVVCERKKKPLRFLYRQGLKDAVKGLTES
jgi:hypothetical protein